jgi:hypothetical protein
LVYSINSLILGRNKNKPFLYKNKINIYIYIYYNMYY